MTLGNSATDAHTITGTLLLNSGPVAVGNRIVYTSTGANTFTKATDIPAHVTHITVHVIGGGGGGGGGHTTGYRGTGGGGGGYAVERIAVADCGATETATVGAGGAGGSAAAPGNAGSAGGTSFFRRLPVCNGG